MSQFDNPYESPPPQPPGYGPPNANQTPLMLAIGSLVASVAGLLSCGCCLFMPLPVVALILGAVALNSRPDPNAKIMAIIGMSLGGLTIVIWVVMFVLQLALGFTAPQFPQPESF